MRDGHRRNWLLYKRDQLRHSLVIGTTQTDGEDEMAAEYIYATRKTLEAAEAYVDALINADIISESEYRHNTIRKEGKVYNIYLRAGY
jgi:hypothetical protein